MILLMQQSSSESGMVLAQPDSSLPEKRYKHLSEWYLSNDDRSRTIDGYDPENADTLLDEYQSFHVVFARDKLACDVGLSAFPNEGKLGISVGTFEWLSREDLSSISEEYEYDDGNGYDVMIRGRPTSGIIAWLSSMPGPDPMTKRAVRHALYWAK